jgi:hypothetical protein
LYENIALLLANPINLNKATADELRFLNLLSEAQVQQLIAYRTTYGPLVSVYELQAVPGFDLTAIYRIVPFVIVRDPSTELNRYFADRMFQSGNSYAVVRYSQTLETKAGFTENVPVSQQFKGNPSGVYMRFRSTRAGDYSVGFTVEKDAGEEMRWNTTTKQYGFDYNSFHAQIQNKRFIKNLLVGDYQVQTGQGLLLGSNFGFGKGSETVTTVRRSNLGFIPYTSINEATYLRGIALTVGLAKGITFSSFYSGAWRDATLLTDTVEQSGVSAFQTSGLHRNEVELDKRKTIFETQAGGWINYKTRQLEAGVVYHYLGFNRTVTPRSNAYNQFALSGNELSNLGGFVHYTLKNFTAFAEAGKTATQGWGMLAGLIGSLSPALDVALHYRNYQRNFYSLYSNAFAESSVPQNESGMYWGWKYRFSKKISMAGYADIFRFPWLRYRSYSPSDGHEWLVRLTYQPVRSVAVYVQWREESKVQNVINADEALYRTAPGRKRNLWINADYSANEYVSFKTRAQFSTYDFDEASTRGMTLVQDVQVKTGKLSFAARYALFDTDDYDNRQYVYERDVWLAYSIPAYNGQGTRAYIMVTLDLLQSLTLGLRWAQTRYTNTDEIGSGADAITGNMRTDVRAQLHYRF